jgi:hypothetical protein
MWWNRYDMAVIKALIIAIITEKYFPTTDQKLIWSLSRAAHWITFSNAVQNSLLGKLRSKMTSEMTQSVA